MPEEGIITSCDIRAKTVTTVLQLLVIIIMLVAIAFVTLVGIHGLFTAIVFNTRGARGLAIFVIALPILVILSRNSSMIRAFGRLIDAETNIFGKEIPSIFVFMFGLAIGSTVVGLAYMQMSPFATAKMSKFVNDIFGYITIVAIALDGVIILGTLLGVGFLFIRFLYRTTIGRSVEIQYAMTNGEVVTATYPWYKAQAIRLSLCTIYEIG